MRPLERRRRRAVACAALFAWLCTATGTARAQSGEDVEARVGRPIAEIIDAFRRRGVPFAYSTELIDPGMTVRETPATDDPVGIVNAILAPYGLAVHEVEGLLVVGRRDEAARAPPPDPPSPAPAPVLPEVTVSASRYEILREIVGAPSFISQREIEQLPLLGDDPLRSLQRLPGNASGGASAKSHLRGAGQQETGLVLNGLRLLDPFHVRDYQNLFSAIDARAINGVEVYTGSYPVRYGDGIGGLVLIDTLTPTRERHTELGLSVYNTSFLSAGHAADGDLEWLLSLRRGNLDLVLNEELGEPSYNDMFAEIAVNPTPATRLSLNGLVANDNVVAVTEADPAERESSTNDTRNAQFWLNWRQDWSDTLTSQTTVATASLRSSRIGAVNDPEEIVASVNDQRDIEVNSLRQDWTWDVNDRHLLSFGARYRRIDARYDYSAAVDWFGSFARLAPGSDSRRRDTRLRFDGDDVGLYVADRWQLGADTVTEFGLRWDRQTWSVPGGDSQLSPRLAVLHRLGTDTELRASLGRYHQSQTVHALPVEDGEMQYAPAQRADQFVLGLQHRWSDRHALRIEAYWKRLSRLRTRYENLLDPLAVMPELKPDRVAVAPERGRARGLELSWGWEPGNGLSGWASWTLAEVQDRVDGRWVDRNWDQRHALQLGLLWAGERWDLSLAANGHSGWPRTGLRIDPQSDPDDPALELLPRNGDRYAPWWSLDLRVGYRAPLRVGELSLFFELSNATDRRNPCCVDFELDDEAPGGPVLEQQDEYWFPLLPAVGVLWEF